MESLKQIVECMTCGTKNRVTSEDLSKLKCGSCKSRLVNQNYYEILEVTQQSTQEEIKKSFRRLALKWHPDKNPENSEIASKKFQKIYEAYSVLSDIEKRKEYNKYLLDTESHYQQEETNFEDAYNMFIQEMYEMAIELAFNNNNWKKIKPYLINQGCPENIAEMISKECEIYRKQLVRSHAKKPFIKALIWMAIGIVITVATYQSASSGGSYLIAWGPMLFGGINMVKALKYLITGSMPK